MKSLATLIRNGDARFARVWSIVSASLLLATAGWSQTLTWLGILSGTESEAYDVSNNGVVVGISSGSSGNRRAFRWTPQTGMQDISTQSAIWSEAWGVPADGSVVAGVFYDGNEVQAFLWTPKTGMLGIGKPRGGTWMGAFAISANGSVVVGGATVPGRQSGFRRTSTGIIDMVGTVAYGVSANGSVVVGMYYEQVDSDQYRRAFRWTLLGGWQDLGTLPGGRESEAWSVSADGSVVVGWSQKNGTPRAFRWTQQTGMQDLGALPNGHVSVARDVSADGSVVVGWADNGQVYRAFRWTQQTGMQDLNEIYASLLTNGSVLIRANAISPNKRYIVGWGFNAATGRFEAFLLDTLGGSPPPGPSDGDVNGDGCVDDADLLTVLFNFGRGCSN